MGDILSQAEVESLLSAMEASHGGPEESAAPAAAAPHPRLREKVIPYDFKRPERVGKEQVQALQSLHEGFARNFGAGLSALLRSIVEVKLTSVDQLTYQEFTFSLENPTCFNVLVAPPLEGRLILDLNPAILYPIIDRLLGGGKESGAVARRPLTEIELRLVGRITRLFLKELRDAWANVMTVDFAVEKVESNPHLVQIVPPNEVVILIGFELSIGDLRGMLNLCIPFNSIERISNKLTSNNWINGRGGANPETVQKVSGQLRRSRVEVVVTLAETTITTAELIGLRVGDVIPTSHDVRQPLEVAVEGVPKFHAVAGAYKGKKAIEVQDAIADPASPSVKSPSPGGTASTGAAPAAQANAPAAAGKRR